MFRGLGIKGLRFEGFRVYLYSGNDRDATAQKLFNAAGKAGRLPAGGGRTVCDAGGHCYVQETLPKAGTKNRRRMKPRRPCSRASFRPRRQRACKQRRRPSTISSCCDLHAQCDRCDRRGESKNGMRAAAVVVASRNVAVSTL